jgi:hypothetical protein
MLPHEVQELWAEVVIRFSRNYSPCNPAKPPCAHKILFFYVAPDGNERWDVRTGGSGEIGPEVHLTMSAPFGEAEGHPDWNTWGVVRALRSIDKPRPQLTLANQYFDEEWHTLRLYARHSTDEKTFDARMAMWMDGELLYDSESMHRQYGTPRFSTKDGARIRSILIGRNKDNGLDRGTESVWVGRIRAWKDDPGWLQ